MYLKKNRWLYLVIFSLCLITCDEEENIKRDYPFLETSDVSNITSEGATFSATINAQNLDDITEHGFVWQIGSSPSLSSSLSIPLGKPTSSEFSAKIESMLAEGLTYHCRAYVKWKGKTIYGNEVKFVSLGSKGPTIDSLSATDIMPDDTLKIFGKNFGFHGGYIQVQIVGNSSAIVKSSDTLLHVIVGMPRYNTLTGKVEIWVTGNKAESKELITYKTPKMLSVDKTDIVLCDTVTITGENLTYFKGQNISLNEQSIPVISCRNDKLTFAINTFISGSIAIKAIVPFTPIKVEAPFTLSQGQTEIISVEPMEYMPGDSITITGKNFDRCPHSGVYLQNEHGGTWYSVPSRRVSSNIVKFKFPADQCFREPIVHVFNTTFSKKLRQKRPKITSIEPTHGDINQSITIKAENIPQLWLNSNEIEIDQISPGEIHARVKDNDSYLVPVNFWNCYASSDTTYFSFDPPEITDISQSTISDFKNDPIIITGKNFRPTANEIYLDNKIIANATSSSDGTQITIYKPWIVGNRYWPNHKTSTLQVRTREQITESATPLIIDYEGSWRTMTDFPGITRAYPISFSINGKGFIGGGSDGTQTLEDFWEFDPIANSWVQKSSLPDGPSTEYIAAVSNERAYVKRNGESNNWWEYDAQVDAWTKKSDFPSSIFIQFIITIDGNIYAGGKLPSTAPELWKYNPTDDTWMQMASPSHDALFSNAAYTLSGKGYIYGQRGAGHFEFLYDPSANAWTERAVSNIGHPYYQDFTTYVFNDYVIIQCGWTPLTFHKIVAGQSDFQNITEHFASPRTFGIGNFVIDNKGYFGLGWSINGYQQKWYSFDPEKF